HFRMQKRPGSSASTQIAFLGRPGALQSSSTTQGRHRCVSFGTQLNVGSAPPPTWLQFQPAGQVLSQVLVQILPCGESTHQPEKHWSLFLQGYPNSPGFGPVSTSWPPSSVATSGVGSRSLDGGASAGFASVTGTSGVIVSTSMPASLAF